MTATTTRTLAFGLALTALGSLTGCDEADGELIGPEGGLVVSDDGRLTLEIPAGALDEDTVVSIEAIEIDGGPEGAVRAYALEPMFTPLARPATVEYDWSVEGADSLSLEDASASEAQLVIERETDWMPLADQEVDVEAQYTAGSAMYFGVVAIVAPAN